MAKQNRGLGIGVRALLGDEADVATIRKSVQYINNPSASSLPRQGDIQLINITQIEPNPFQPRITFDEQAMSELAASIKSLGLIQPITVRSLSSGKYQIISGERRFRASRMAGLHAIPAYIRTTDDKGMLEMAIVENVQRADLDPIETALSYRRLIEECSLTQEQMADRIGKGRVTVTNFLRLLKLPAKVQYELKVGNISVGHAKVLLSVEDASVQEELCDEILRSGMSVRALEQLVHNIGKTRPSRNAAHQEQDLPDDYYSVAERLGHYFDNNVSVRRNPAGKGSITIRFASDDQVQKFLKVLQDNNL